jgi:hypothetical protein
MPRKQSWAIVSWAAANQSYEREAHLAGTSTTHARSLVLVGALLAVLAGTVFGRWRCHVHHTCKRPSINEQRRGRRREH